MKKKLKDIFVGKIKIVKNFFHNKKLLKKIFGILSVFTEKLSVKIPIINVYTLIKST